MQKFKNWLLNSSVDPDKWSLTVKSFGLTLVPVLIVVANTMFGLGLEQSQMIDAVTTFATLVGVLVTAFGLARKLYFSFKK